MKFKLISITILTFSLSFLLAQTLTIEDDFEGNGTISSWYGDNCNLNTSFNNPFKQGINLSDKVLEYHDVGGQYANVRFNAANNFELNTYNTFSFKIYIPSSSLTGSQLNQVSLKLQDGTKANPWTTQSQIVKPLTLDQWQTVNFDFENDNYINFDASSPSPSQRTDFNRVLIQVNGENNNDQVLAYIDDVSYDGTILSDPVYDYLVWSDEFDTDGPILSTHWFHQTQIPQNGSWFNGEIQHYTDKIDNTFVDNGLLHLVAKKESYTSQGITKEYTSARLNSKFAFTYGKVEVRAKLPEGIGTWPAIWMLGKNINEDGGYWDNLGFDTSSWPYCGEIDIMEHWGSDQNVIKSATHTPSSFGGTVNTGGQNIATASTDFHTYTLVWTPYKLMFSVDGIPHYTYNPAIKDINTWPFDADQYLLLNLAILPEISPTFSSGAMEIDFVRVYQESSLSLQDIQENIVARVYPLPFDDQLNIQLNNIPNQHTLLRLYAIDGKLINTYDAEINENSLVLNKLNNLSEGLYFLNFEINKQTHRLAVVKN